MLQNLGYGHLKVKDGNVFHKNTRTNDYTKTSISHDKRLVLRCKAVKVLAVGLIFGSSHSWETPINTLFNRLGQFAK